MAKLTTKARKALPAKTFAGPGRSFPIPDKGHAKAALSLVGRAQKAGSVNAKQAATIRDKAEAKLGKASNDGYGNKSAQARHTAGPSGHMKYVG